MTVNLKGNVRYDGTNFSGWQVQPHVRTVQGELERCLTQIAGQNIRVVGASRTDAGVHALQQVFSFRWPSTKPYATLPRSLSSMLAPEINVFGVEQVDDNFHARFSAKKKRYVYSLVQRCTIDPFLARYAWHIPWDLDRGLLQKLTEKLCGTRDFSGFQSAGSPSGSTVRTLYRVEVSDGCAISPFDVKDAWQIVFEGDGFLYHMVRNIVGTLVEIARGKRTESWLEERLESSGPFVGLTAPAHGLTLVSVSY
ncbi:MAG TPA: tRNA pseudouridine(38-40) synthase TruA [Candidatus Hydrogenedentes bacterium]|nr:tRNA pseudouridine(38-40) synthase TruA [Candidatus Hydrogenedentota bacterium]HOL77394.1 tRNA pseudouridine(38-40) synthase TruA [Candidatus Hydrogenedentota bacterium]HPO87589.1 tRNA pseudouridine(38-40) synthase TruA [Candidatus Hydrogenedentota bacterium]